MQQSSKKGPTGNNQSNSEHSVDKEVGQVADTFFDADPHSIGNKVKQNPANLKPKDAIILQRWLGNRAVTNLIKSKKNADRSQSTLFGPPLARLLENESVNKLVPELAEIKLFANQLSAGVEEARGMIMSKYFIHIPPADGYMQALVDNFDAKTNKFKNASKVPRQAGYWIESYATKVLNPRPATMARLLQATRGKSRPDVVLQKNGSDLAWLDITSSKSGGHIFNKDHAGWLGTPYVTEVTYPGISVLELNSVSVPDKSSKDLSTLLAKANQALEETLNWEQMVLEKYGFQFGTLLQNAVSHIKGRAVESYDLISDDEHDERFAPDSPDNEFSKAVCTNVGMLVKQPVEPEELAAAAMYLQGAMTRYEKRFGGKLPDQFKIPNKAAMGLTWVKDVSSADGEPILRKWFKV